MGTKDRPNPNDCYDKAYPDEPMFTLLALDKAAPALVRAWAEERRSSIDSATYREALLCANAMVIWRNAQGNRKVICWRCDGEGRTGPAGFDDPCWACEGTGEGRLRDFMARITEGKMPPPVEPKCEECGAGVDRPKCMWEMGAGCPRHEAKSEYSALKRRYARVKERGTA